MLIDSDFTSMIADPVTIFLMSVLLALGAVSWISAKKARRDSIIKLRLATVCGKRTTASNVWFEADEIDGGDAETPLQMIYNVVVKQLSPLVRVIPFIGEKDREKLAQLLAQAGFRSSEGLTVLLGVKFAFAVSGALSAYAFVTLGNYFSGSIGFQFLSILVGLVIGSVTVEYVLKHFVKRRSNAIRDTIPDAMDLLVICAEAGLSLDHALKRVATEMKIAAPQLASELQTTADELTILSDRNEALENLIYRTNVSELQNLVMALLQAERYGTSLAHSMRVIATESRNERMLRLEDKAARMPTILSLPLMGLVMPPVLVIIGGPAVISLTDVLQ